MESGLRTDRRLHPLHFATRIFHDYDRRAVQAQRAIDGLQHPHHAFAVTPARDRPDARSNAVDEVPALILQRLAGFELRAHDVAVADLQAMLAVGERFGGGLDPLFKHTHLLDAVEIVEHHAAIAADNDQFARLVRIGPAHVDVPDDVGAIAGIPE